jgi:hypothetical protein
MVFIDDEKEFKEWRAQPEGGKSIALSRFIGNFAVVSSPNRRRACDLSFKVAGRAPPSSSQLPR